MYRGKGTTHSPSIFHRRLCYHKAQESTPPVDRTWYTRSATSSTRLLIVLLLLFLLIVLAGLAEEVNPGVGALLDDLGLSLAELADLVSGAGHALEVTSNLATANQRGDNGAANNEGENETVDTVPRRSQALLGSTRIGVVHEVEDQELRDQGRLNGHENSGRGSCGGKDTNLVALVALVTAKASELETPVDGAGERDDLRDVSAINAFSVSQRSEHIPQHRRRPG